MITSLLDALVNEIASVRSETFTAFGPSRWGVRVMLSREGVICLMDELRDQTDGIGWLEPDGPPSLIAHVGGAEVYYVPDYVPDALPAGFLISLVRDT